MSFIKGVAIREYVIWGLPVLNFNSSGIEQSRFIGICLIFLYINDSLKIKHWLKKKLEYSLDPHWLDLLKKVITRNEICKECGNEFIKYGNRLQWVLLDTTNKIVQSLIIVVLYQTKKMSITPSVL